LGQGRCDFVVSVTVSSVDVRVVICVSFSVKVRIKVRVRVVLVIVAGVFDHVVVEDPFVGAVAVRESITEALLWAVTKLFVERICLVVAAIEIFCSVAAVVA
jgi:hypothetical protein